MNRFKPCFSRIAGLRRTMFTCLAVVSILGFSAGTALALDFEVKGTKASIGGYLKLMANYDINGTLGGNTNHPTDGDIINAYDTPLDGSAYDSENNFSMTARESRIFVKTETMSDLGLVTTYFEGDANGDVGGSPTWSNSRAFRLRHACGTIAFGDNKVLAGQTWSTFMDFAAAVPVMDLSSDPGVTFVRQPQIRFTHSFSKGHFLALAAENPDSGLTRNGNGLLVTNAPTTTSDNMPDFIVKYFWSNKNFHISPKLLVRSFELNDQSTMGWGVSLTSHIGFGKGHKVYAGVLYGEGMGRYGGLGLNTGAGLTATGDIETVKFTSFNTGVTIALKDNLAWTIGCGYSENDEDAYTGSKAVLSGNANKEAFSWHTNLKWQITPTVSYAVGLIGMSQELMDGREGDMMRLQNYIQYTF